MKDDIELNFDIDIADDEEEYLRKKEDERVENKFVSEVQDIKGSLTNIVEKQAEALVKNTEHMDNMQHNMTTIIDSQANLVNSVSKAIDSKFNQQRVNYIDAVDNQIQEVVVEPLQEIRRKRRFKRVSTGVIKFLVIAGICLILWGIPACRAKIILISGDIKDIVVGIYNGEEVSSNKLVEDLGFRLSAITTKYYDASGNLISEEEYLRLKQNGDEATKSDSINFIKER